VHRGRAKVEVRRGKGERGAAAGAVAAQRGHGEQVAPARPGQGGGRYYCPIGNDGWFCASDSRSFG
jgi:hypothetical protein